MAMQEELKHLRDLATDLLAKRQEGKADDQVTKDLAASGLLSLLRLRSANKSVALSTEELREDTSKAKCSLEQADLALQNLLYESQYYEKEIQSCRGFQSAYPDAQIALQPVEEFWASADADLVAKAREQGSAHELMLQRLSHEMRLRRKMAKHLEGLKQAKSSLLQQVSEQEKVLKLLQGNLKVLDDSARPLQGVLSGYPALRGITRTAAELLPVALYVLFSQLCAAKEALGLPINVTISGLQEEAVALADQVAAEALESGEEQRRLAKKRRLNTADDIYKMHPLAVDLELRKEGNNGKPQVLLTVKFNYLLNLNLVTAICGDAADSPLLGALFPLDDGTTVPTETLMQLDNGTFQLDPTQSAKPYKWCQHIAGIDLIPSLPLLPSQLQSSDQAQLLDGLATYRTQQRVVTVIQRLQAVKEAHAVLNALLTKLVRHSLPLDTSNYARLPQTALTAWELVKTVTTNVTAKPTFQHLDQQIATQQRPQTPPNANAELPADNAVAAEGGPEEGEALPGNIAGPSNGQLEAANGLDEGEIPGSPSTRPVLELPDDDGFDYSQQLMSPGAQQPAPIYFSLDTPSGPADDNPQQAVPKPPFRLYRCVLRRQHLEVEVHVRLYLEYPVRPPLLMVQGIRELPKDKGGKARMLDMMNEKLTLEQEANITAVQATPASSRHEMLLHQLLHLRLCVDDLAAQYVAESGSSAAKELELAHLLQARQRRRGRDRRPPVVCLNQEDVTK